MFSISHVSFILLKMWPLDKSVMYVAHICDSCYISVGQCGG